MEKDRLSVYIESNLLNFVVSLSKNNGISEKDAYEFLIKKGFVLLSLNVPDINYTPSDERKIIKCITLSKETCNKIREISEKRRLFAEKYLHFGKKKEMLKKSKISYIVNELLYYGMLSLEYGL